MSMSRLLLGFCLCLLLVSCQNDSAHTTETPSTLPPPQATPAKQPAPRPVDGQTVPTVDDALQLTPLAVAASPGTEACVQMRADGFERLLAMQYTLRWDADKLKYKKVMVGTFPQFTTSNINEKMVAQGLLPLVWIDNDLQGITLPDGTILYQVCFDVIGKAGTKATVGFTNKPTSFEVVNDQEQVLVFRGQTGEVSIN